MVARDWRVKVMNRVSSRAICSAIALSLGFTSQSAFSHSSSSLKIDSCYCYTAATCDESKSSSYLCCSDYPPTGIAL